MRGTSGEATSRPSADVDSPPQPTFHGLVARHRRGAGTGTLARVRLAELGAAVIAVDVCADLGFVPYPQPTRDDLDETAALVAKTGGRCVTAVADVRDGEAMAAAVEQGRPSPARSTWSAQRPV